MTTLLSDIYDVTLKRGIRGKASEGFIRPTIGQNFMTHRDFIEILNIATIGERQLFNGSYVSDFITCTKLTNTTALVTYRSSQSNYTTKANIITFNANDHTISFSSASLLQSTQTHYTVATRLRDNISVLAYRLQIHPTYPLSVQVVEAIGDTVVSRGTVIFDTTITENPSITNITNTKSIVAWDSSSGIPKVNLLNYTEENTISAGTNLNLAGVRYGYASVCRLSDTRAIVVFRGYTALSLVAFLIDVSGTSCELIHSLSLGENTYTSQLIPLTETSCVLGTDNKITILSTVGDTIAISSTTNNPSTVGTITNLTSLSNTKFIASYNNSDGSGAKICFGSINNNVATFNNPIDYSDDYLYYNAMTMLDVDTLINCNYKADIGAAANLIYNL